MTEAHFWDLDEMEQAEALWQHGVLLGDRTEGAYKIISYSMGDFYLDVYYHAEMNVIRKFVTFTSPYTGTDIF